MFGFSNIFRRYPSSLMIEPTNVCNLNCPTCPTGSGKMKRPRRMMSLSEFKGIIDQAEGYVENITLWNYGEPFMNKDLLFMIEYAVLNGMHVVTSTNGEFFNSKEFCKKIVRSGLQQLIICLDGADQETISRFRKGSHFEKIVQGIEFMVEMKRALHSKTPTIELQFIVMRHNEHQKSHIQQLATTLGVDVFREKTVGINGLDPDFQNLARELLPTDLSSSRFYQKKDGSYALKGEIQNQCSWVNQTAVINADGTLVPCCYDLYSQYILGNIFEQSLRNIWNDNKYRYFRKQIKKDRKSLSICSKCPEGRYAIEKITALK